MTTNPRKLRIWDVETLGEVLEVTEQIRNKILVMMENMEGDVEVSDLPASLVPTDTLYNIVACFTVMYSMLLDEHLIKSGNKKQDKQLH